MADVTDLDECCSPLVKMESLQWVRSRNSRLHTDLEMQYPGKTQENGTVERDRAEAIRYLLGLPEEQIRQWPGASAYCQYLEGCFSPLLEDDYASIWNASGMQRPRTGATCWPWFNTVCSKARSLNEDISIEEVWSAMTASRSSDSRPDTESAEESMCFIAIFAVLCWGTMTLRPGLSRADFRGVPSLMVYRQRSDQQRLKMSVAHRPISVVFRQLQTRPRLGGRWQQSIGESRTSESTTLHVSSLSYASLKTTGKIRLAWVDDLSSHLDFDSAQRQLSIFRFPTFCALSTLEGSTQPPVFAKLVSVMYCAESDTQHDCMIVHLHQEVLMSYRLLFGQTRGSRRLAQSAVKALKHKTLDQSHDPLLDILCNSASHSLVRTLPSSMWPVSCRDFDGALQEENTYSSLDDFPMFGQRLAKLQEFNLRQRPSKLRDLWRDQRDPLQWNTFWAVLIFGGWSLLLALLQLAVGVVQIIVAYELQGRGAPVAAGPA